MQVMLLLLLVRVRRVVLVRMVVLSAHAGRRREVAGGLGRVVGGSATVALQK